MRLLVDVDNVLADFGSEFERVLRDRGAYIPTKLKSSYYLEEAYSLPRAVVAAAIRDMDASKIPIVKGAKDFIDRALTLEYNVYFVTSYPAVEGLPVYGWRDKRDEWLQEHFGELGKNVVHTGHKYLCDGDVFIDDKPSNVFTWAKHHRDKRALLWSQFHNLKESLPLLPKLFRVGSFSAAEMHLVMEKSHAEG